MCHAEVITADQARTLAQGFVSQGSTKFKAGVSLSLAHQARAHDGKPDYYVFNVGNDDGFVVISGDDRTVPVWGYSTNGTFDYELMPDNAKWWFSEYQRQLQFLRDNPKVKPRKATTLNAHVDPLLTTKWDQCYPYNFHCPPAPGLKEENNTNYYRERVPTGCNATALAQIMYKHRWPNVGRGSHSYQCKVKWESKDGHSYTRKDNLSVDFSQSHYNWSQMLTDYRNAEPTNAQITAISKLMSDIGIAIETDYNGNGSGSDNERVVNKQPIMTHFGYNQDAFERNGYNGNWDELLRAAIDQGFPLFYTGDYNWVTEDGHAFVLDGYNEEGKFHINWGWSGSWNGYYESSLTEPVLTNEDGTGGYAFQYNQVAVVFWPDKEGYKNLGAQMTGKRFGTVRKNSHTSLSMNVAGQNLDQDVIISLSGQDAGMFSTDASMTADEANAEGGKSVKVTYQPNATGDHTATLTISAGEDVEPITFTIAGSARVNYDANGDEQADISDIIMAIDAVLNDGLLDFSDEAPDVETIIAMINAILSGESEIDVDDGLVAYYPFNGDARDMSGHGNDGEVNNVWPTHGVNGDTNGAWHFGGYNHPGYIHIPNSESLQFTDGFTFACYVKPLDWCGMDGWGNYSDNTNPNRLANHCIFAKDHDRRGPCLWVRLNTNANMFAYVDRNNSSQDYWPRLSSGDKINGNKLNEWVHIAVTYTKTKSRMYIDGRLVDEHDINADFAEINRNDLYLGRFSATWYPLNGVLDEVRIYNRSLTAAEVKQLAGDNSATHEETHPFKLSQKAVTLAVGKTLTINMLNGSGCYSVGCNSSIVDFTLDNDGDYFTLTGIGAGTTNVTVIDVNTQTTIQLPVTVTQPQSATYQSHLKLNVNGIITEQDITPIVINNNDGSYDLILKNFVLFYDGFAMPVGTITLKGLAGVTNNGSTTISYNGTIEINEGDDPNYDDWVGTLLGALNINMTLEFNDKTLSAYCWVDGSALGQEIVVYIE